MLNNTGWRGAENPWLVDMRGVEELQRRLGLLRGDGRKSVAKDRVRVGIVNRRDGAHWPPDLRGTRWDYV